ncbi:hypothetical protein VA599_00390 [Chromobacterium sp. TRC.1.1.SA]|uniref:Uncharacterized protein n=1 Tax=Chromobacterium indicum TaxID=3110228 RepID=A0ABV0CGQ7_9NEIS
MGKPDELQVSVEVGDFIDQLKGVFEEVRETFPHLSEGLFCALAQYAIKTSDFAAKINTPGLTIRDADGNVMVDMTGIGAAYIREQLSVDQIDIEGLRITRGGSIAVVQPDQVLVSIDAIHIEGQIRAALAALDGSS